MLDRTVLSIGTCAALLLGMPAAAVWVKSQGDPLGCGVVPWPTPDHSICAEWVDDPGGEIDPTCCVRKEDLGSLSPSLYPGECAMPRAVDTGVDPRPAPGPLDRSRSRRQAFEAVAPSTLATLAPATALAPASCLVSQILACADDDGSSCIPRAIQLCLPAFPVGASRGL